LRICLIGDYSGFHANLKIGLEQLGCEVTVFSDGDGWKKITNDVSFGSGFLGLGGRLIDQFWVPDFYKMKSLGRFDVVQFINPCIYPFNIAYKFGSSLPNKIFIQTALSQSKKSFLISAGIDYFYTKECLNGSFRYEPISDCLEMDRGSKIKQFFRYDWMSPVMSELNYWLVDQVDGVIPLHYENYLACKLNKLYNLRKVITMPLDVSKINVSYPADSDRVLHGLNKPGFKGFRHIKNAFDILANKHSSIEFLIQQSLPLGDYIKSLENISIIVDQVSSYSYAMNALYSMASGKIVISGAEPECLEANNIPQEGFLINALPDENSIIDAVERSIHYARNNPKYPDATRAFVEKYHNPKKIAERFLQQWFSS
jgi:hypothetical protein